MIQFTSKHNYYMNKETQFRLLNAFKDKEVILMIYKKDKTFYFVRGLFIRHTEIFNNLYNHFQLHKKNFNIYVSCAYYKNIPVFKFDDNNQTHERGKILYKWFREESTKEMYNYDLFLDFDSKEKDMLTVKNEVVKMKSILTLYKIPHRVVNSGRYFHLIINGKVLDEKPVFTVDRIGKSLNNYCFHLLKDFKERFNLTTLDLTGAGVYNKIRKCEYSIANDLICYPNLTATQIAMFDKREFKYNHHHIKAHLKLKADPIKIHNDIIHNYLDQHKEAWLRFKKECFIETPLY